MTYTELAKILNKLIRQKARFLNFLDCEKLGIGTGWDAKTMLEMCGCDVEKVHDLFNVTLPAKTITKQDIYYLNMMD